jgi:Pyruvate/2-oxoacid:ferredoxin oxidoreductase delta subunit
MIAREHLDRLIQALLDDYALIAPVRRQDSLVFDAVGASDEVVLDESIDARPSAKGVFFPRSEIMFLLDEHGMLSAALEERPPQVLLGVRPCDAASLALLDAVFLDASGDPDPYYAARRAATTVIGQSCLQPASTCFCNWMGGSPFGQKGLDLLLTDLGDRYLLEGVSPKGESLLGSLEAALPGDAVASATADDLAQRAELARVSGEQLPVGGIAEDLAQTLAAAYDDAFWDALHEKCLGCGVCTYLCPTCHCFDILDEDNGHRGRRVRIWDSCQYAQFTKHASGHNPRPAGKERMRQRVMHKFRYFVDNYGERACVGCGRCVRYCPANMDIREVLGAVAELDPVETQ